MIAATDCHPYFGASAAHAAAEQLNGSLRATPSRRVLRTREQLPQVVTCGGGQIEILQTPVATLAGEVSSVQLGLPDEILHELLRGIATARRAGLGDRAVAAERDRARSPTTGGGPRGLPRR